MRLTREIRFALTEPSGAVLNAWAGWPASDALVPHLKLRVTLSGRVDDATGYLCNIKVVDEWLRRGAIPFLRQCAGKPAPVAVWMPELWRHLLPDHPPGLSMAALELDVSPFLRWAVHDGDPTMVRMTESFEFSASHRLYCPQLAAEENRRLFGKCANPHGHGHNYVVDVTVAGRPDDGTGTITPLPHLEGVVKEQVIDRFDHKHLNLDCPEFATLNPTVENITRIIWDLLDGRFEPATLACVRVWETPKTWAEYDGDVELM